MIMNKPTLTILIFNFMVEKNTKNEFGTYFFFITNLSIYVHLCGYASFHALFL
jgi:hypothetical protein